MNLTILPAHVTLDSLAEQMVASGLMNKSDWEAAVAEAHGDVQELARQLTQRGVLTPYQLAELTLGRGASLRVGNYEILDRLGAGGMGTVFKARHRRMKRVVALKVLAANLSENQVFVQRFQREVETIASLGHPNIVMAYDADEAEVGHFLVMEFVHGEDLAAYVSSHGPLPVPLAVDCLLQAARGLAYAHTQEIVHRDVKPHNLLRDTQGVVKVTDLGLARLSHGVEQPAEQTAVTMAGGVIGTVDYMSPEQAIDSTTIDHRADIYSLGCTLYYLLTGNPPYTGPTIMSILLKHRDAEIPQLSAVRNDVPPALDDLLRRLLAKQPEQRIQQMNEVVQALEALAETLGGLPSASVAASHSAGLPSSVRSPLPERDTARLSDATVSLPPPNTPFTVLVVEPSRVQAAIIRGYLQEQGHSVVGVVSDGAKAIEAVHTLRPQAVIAALYLSDLNGIELARQIRSAITVDAPGFVLITSGSAEIDGASLQQLNRVTLLAKPFTASQLQHAIGEVTGASLALASGPLAAGSGLPWGGPGGDGQRPRIDRSQLRVMIVDDSGVARIRVKEVLTSLGVRQFVEFPDGAQALAATSREICQLIVTDYNMPLMDGRALVSYLKQNPATSSIPILMFTSETDPRILEPVRRLGVVAILEKSFPAHVVGPLLDSLF
ncbi:MAG: serine/threonine-protein kinase [Pirellulales bacterium]